MLKKTGFEALATKPRPNEIASRFGISVVDPVAKCWSYRTIPGQTCHDLTLVPIKRSENPDLTAQIIQAFNQNMQSYSLDPYDSQPVVDIENQPNPPVYMEENVLNSDCEYFDPNDIYPTDYTCYA